MSPPATAELAPPQSFEEGLKGAETSVPGPPSPPKTFADLETWFLTEMAEWKKRNEAAQRKAEDVLKERTETLKPTREELLQALRTPFPTPPSAPEEPAPPSRKPRPFLEGMPGESPSTTLNRSLMSLGLLVQMAAGLRGGYPEGALAAYTGALQGWALGDQERAEAAWADYLANVEHSQRDWLKRRTIYQDTMNQREKTIQDLQHELGIKMSEAGDAQASVDLAFRDADQFGKMLDVEGKFLGKLYADSQRLTLQYFLQKEREAMRTQMTPFQLAELSEKQIKSSVDPLTTAGTVMKRFDVLRTAFRNLDAHDMLPTGTETVEAWVKRFQRAFERGDPDVVTIRNFWNPTVITFDRTTLNEKGIRIAAAFTSQMESGTMMGPLSTMEAVVQKYQDAIWDATKKFSDRVELDPTLLPWVRREIERQLGLVKRSYQAAPSMPSEEENLLRQAQEIMER